MRLLNAIGLRTAFLVCGLLAGTATSAQATSPAATDGSGPLVSTDWLEKNLRDPKLRVIEVSVNPGVYEKGHIPGAQFVDLQADLSDQTTKLRFMAPPAEEFAAAMRRFGVSADSREVLYSTANVWWATRIWWLLRMFGFDNAAVLDGGFQAWKREGRPVEPGPGRARPLRPPPRAGRGP